MAGVQLNYYPYIQKFPYYIHNEPNNLENTAKTIYDKNFSGEKLQKNKKVLYEIINFQKEREDKILKELGIKNDEEIESLFIRLGFIEGNDLQRKLINKIDEITKTTAYIDERKLLREPVNAMLKEKEKELKGKNSKEEKILRKKATLRFVEPYEELMEEIFESFKKDITIIINDMQDIIDEYSKETGNQINLSVLKKLADFRDTHFKKTNIDYAYLLYDHINSLQGKLSTYAPSIMEDIKVQSDSLITQEDSNNKFELLTKADDYRSKNIKQAMRLAKADTLIVKKKFEKGIQIVIPIAGITAKKITDNRIKIHDTTNIDPFIDYIKKYSGYIDENELNLDLNILQYLLRNIVFYNVNDYENVSNSLRNFGIKYGFTFLANGIYREILNGNPDDSLKNIFSYEHADFTFKIQGKKTKIGRVSDDLTNFVENSNVTISSNFGTQSNATVRRVKEELYNNYRRDGMGLLDIIKKDKKSIQPFSYEAAINNSLLTYHMKRVNLKGAMQIRVDITGVI